MTTTFSPTLRVAVDAGTAANVTPGASMRTTAMSRYPSTARTPPVYVADAGAPIVGDAWTVMLSIVAAMFQSPYRMATPGASGATRFAGASTSPLGSTIRPKPVSVYGSPPRVTPSTSSCTKAVGLIGRSTWVRSPDGAGDGSAVSAGPLAASESVSAMASAPTQRRGRRNRMVVIGPPPPTPRTSRTRPASRRSGRPALPSR